MRDLLFATHNPNKVREIREILASYGLDGFRVLSLSDIGYTADIPETGETFAENAWLKADAIAKPGIYVAADDSGLEVDALDGAPGVYSARYAGVEQDDAANNKKLLSALADVPEQRRTARFTCVVALQTPEGERHIFRGECRGHIAQKAMGQGGFGYDPLFVPEGADRCFALYTPEEKNAVSHRGQAIRAMAAFVAEKEKRGEQPC